MTTRNGTDTEIVAALTVGPDEGPAAARHERLVSEADRHGLLDVTYRVIDTPYGPMLLAATAEGLVRVAFDSEGLDDVLDELAGRVSPRLLGSHRRTDAAARQLDEYFAGDRRGFDLELDLRLAVGFRRAVVTHLGEIAYGETETYSEVAAAAGNPRAVRAAGSACANNPLPIVLPCHRVVRSDGTIGRYGGGSDMKVALLAMEAAP